MCYISGWGCKCSMQVDFGVAGFPFDLRDVRACDVERSKRECVCESECGSACESVVSLICASK